MLFIRKQVLRSCQQNKTKKTEPNTKKLTISIILWLKTTKYVNEFRNKAISVSSFGVLRITIHIDHDSSSSLTPTNLGFVAFSTN